MTRIEGFGGFGDRLWGDRFLGYFVSRNQLGRG